MALEIEFAGRRPVVDPGAFVAPTLVLVGDVTVAAGASVWYGAVLRADFGPIVVGAGSNVQDNCVLHAAEGLPTVLEDEVTVGHLATMESWVIEHGALIGMGAVVLQRARVGRGSVVAAGSVVAEDAQIPPTCWPPASPPRASANCPARRSSEAAPPPGSTSGWPPLSGRSPGRPADIGRVGIGRLAAICWRRA
jgi:carbonic anhydrase/acetyltransferase-like protein (isoleucine patch superfamily)